MPNLVTTMSARIYGITDAVKMFQRFEHDGWSAMLSSEGQGCVSYQLIVADIPAAIFTMTFHMESVEADMDY